MTDEQFGRMDTKLDGIVKKVDRIDHTINGNGSDGLKVKVDRNTQGLITIKKLCALAITVALAIAGLVIALL